MVTKYGPKEPLSPTIGELCPLCGVAFKAGDYTALIRTTRHSRYCDQKVEVHWDCATKVAD